ncbi:MAG: hypothetical protein WCD12_16960 [Candidatus Binatus sp.]
MSMVGLAASPGTDVLPTCSILAASPPRASATLARNVSYRRGHPGS